MLRANEKRLHLGGRLQDVFSGPRMGIAAEIMADSPVVYCPLLETSGSSCDQRGSSGVTATAQGTYVRTANGIVFGGSTAAGLDFVQVGDAASNRLPGDMTLECICLPMRDSLDIFGCILFDKPNDGPNGPGYLLRLMADGSLQILKDGVAVLASSNQTNLWDGRLHHVAVTRSGNNFTFYVDHVVVGTGTSATAVAATTAPWRIGAGGTFSWPGTIAHAAIYASALSATRIKAHSDSYVQPSLLKSEYGAYDTVVATDRPVLWLRLDESSGTFLNRGWYGDVATAHGTITRSVATGRSIGNGVTFGGTNADYITFPNGLDCGSMFTYEAWLKVPALAANVGIMGKCKDTNNNQGAWYQILSATRKAAMNKFTAADVLDTSSAIPNDSAFHHLVFTREGSNNGSGVCTWYLDGVANIGGVYTTAFAAVNQPFNLGIANDQPGTGFGNPYPGSMAQVAVYNYALTSAQVYQHWLAGQ